MNYKEKVLKIYLNEAGKYKPLSNEEEKKLFVQYKNGDRTGKELLVKHNLSLVINIVKEILLENNLKEDMLLELIEEGNIEMLECIDKYDICSENSFSTFLTKEVKKVILEYIKGYIKNTKVRINNNEELLMENNNSINKNLKK